MLSWIFIVLAHWHNSLWIDMSPHSDTLSWFRANFSLLFLHNDVSLAEKQYHFYSLWFDLIGTLTYDLSHSRRTRWPLHHRCGYNLEIYIVLLLDNVYHWLWHILCVSFNTKIVQHICSMTHVWHMFDTCIHYPNLILHV